MKINKTPEQPKVWLLKSQYQTTIIPCILSLKHHYKSNSQRKYTSTKVSILSGEKQKTKL